MKILALELSAARGGLAWLEGTVELVREWRNDRKDSAAFFQNLDFVTKKVGAPERIIVGLGPGSYAGTRIAISAAIGLQHAFRARLTGYPSICAMESDEEEYCVVGDARRKSFFFAQVRANEVIAGPTLFTEQELKMKLESLDATIPIFSSDSLPQLDRVVVRYPSAVLLARLAREPRHGFFSPPLEPIYLREPHITMAATGPAK
jgi:tRNA threonylcarbamoyladenosine biosynthesis protein TsaB